MDKEKHSCLGFSLFGLSPVKFQEILSEFGSSTKAYLSSSLGDKLGERFVRFRRETDLKKEEDNLKKAKIGYIARVEEQYPVLLRQISDPPIGLFYKGNYNCFNFAQGIFFAIVGTRTPSPYGRGITADLARQLAAWGIVIVSGLARGIDALSHFGALSAHGRTIAVLGGGVKVIYPKENAGLYHKIIKNQGLVFSEFAPDAPVARAQFAVRNRIIAGLSRGVLVIEGKEHSGTLITARLALKEGREVLAIPGQINRQTAFAPNLLLKNGAYPVTSAKDVIDALNVVRRYNS